MTITNLPRLCVICGGTGKCKSDLTMNEMRCFACNGTGYTHAIGLPPVAPPVAEEPASDLQKIRQHYEEYMADSAAISFGAKFPDWAAAKYPSEYGCATSPVAEAIPAQAGASINAAAWVTPLRYGSKVTFPRPPKPDDWDDDEQEWFCHPLFTADQMTAYGQQQREEGRRDILHPKGFEEEGHRMVTRFITAANEAKERAEKAEAALAKVSGGPVLW